VLAELGLQSVLPDALKEAQLARPQLAESDCETKELNHEKDERYEKRRTGKLGCDAALEFILDVVVVLVFFFIVEVVVVEVFIVEVVEIVVVEVVVEIVVFVLIIIIVVVVVEFIAEFIVVIGPQDGVEVDGIRRK
jgi:hypothetical protein